jgi:hypothetical protein
MVVAGIIPSYSLLAFDLFRLSMDITLNSPSYYSLDDSMSGMPPLKIQSLFIRLPNQHVVKSSEGGISLNIVHN